MSDQENIIRTKYEAAKTQAEQLDNRIRADRQALTDFITEANGKIADAEKHIGQLGQALIAIRATRDTLADLLPKDEPEELDQAEGLELVPADIESEKQEE